MGRGPNADEAQVLATSEKVDHLESTDGAIQATSDETQRGNLITDQRTKP